MSFFFLSVFIISCKSDKSDDLASDYSDFMIMNILQSENFSLYPYHTLKNIEGETCKLSHVITKPKLVLRFSERNCELCIQSEIDLINKLNISDDIVGFASYSNARLLKLIQQKYRIQFPVYLLPYSTDILPEIKEKLGVPYLFLIDTDLHSKYIFFPSKEHSEFSEKYYNEMMNLISNKKIVDIFDEKNVNLGEVLQGQTYRVSFKYTNMTSGLLIIRDITSSCGCTVPQWDKMPLAENDSSKLIVLFTPETLGYNSKVVMVSHNKCRYPLRLMIRANVTSD